MPSGPTLFRLIHTADWHLGQMLFGYDRETEHAGFLRWLLEVIGNERPDALLIAGDVFDTVNPSAAAQRLWFGFLAEAVRLRPDLQIIVTAGNHDPAARLEAPSQLMEALRIRAVGTMQRTPESDIDFDRLAIPLRDSNDQLRAVVLPVPFLRPADLPCSSDTDNSYVGGVREVFRRCTDRGAEIMAAENAQVPLIAMGHCHVQGGSESADSERRLVIGNAEAIPPDVFPAELAYTALGHLHRPQRIRSDNIRYSGSAIPLSFAEVNYRHGVTIAEFEGTEATRIEHVHCPSPCRLISVPHQGAASTDELGDLLRRLPEADDSDSSEPPPLLEVRILNTGPDPLRRKRIEEMLEGKSVRLASIRLVQPESVPDSGTDRSLPTVNPADLQKLDPMQVLSDTFRAEFGAEPDELIVRAFREILTEESSA